MKDADYQKLNSKTNPTALVDVDPNELGGNIGNLDAHQARYHSSSLIILQTTVW